MSSTMTISSEEYCPALGTYVSVKVQGEKQEFLVKGKIIYCYLESCQYRNMEKCLIGKDIKVIA